MTHNLSGAVTMTAGVDGDNVVAFRSKRALSDTDHIHIVGTIEEAVEGKKLFVGDVVEFLMEQLETHLINNGIGLTSNRNDPRDIIMIQQVLEAACYRHYGIAHPMHEVISQAISFTDEEGNEIDLDGNDEHSEEELGETVQ
ncbi:hypothetical protein EVB91_101 [Rhizobium phage RHph_I1_18]|nr:hypothetical protein EVB91_101 [Rhizobium phage RHph_I1_18]